MELSILIARILALTYIAFGFAAFSGRITFEKIVEEFERSQALSFVIGFLTLEAGIIMVQYHNIWVKDWRVLITVVGWTSLLKGIMLIAFPQAVSSFKGLYKNTRVWGIVMIILGAVFGFWGFAG